MSLKEKQPEDLKLYYTIGEVSALLGVNASLIRFWEKEFPALKPKKNKKGNRLFTKSDIQHLKEIYHWVKEQGFTLEGARKKMLADKKIKSQIGRSGMESERFNTIEALLDELELLLKK
jgi:DNA-binding transcriptional MerR regulator